MDAKRLLEQFLGGGGRGQGGFGNVGPSGGLGDIGRVLGGLSGGGGGGSLAAGLAGLLLGSKSGRRFGGSAAKAGGMALVASLAFRAFQNWQASQGQGGAQAGGGFADPASRPRGLAGSAAPSSGGSVPGEAGGFLTVPPAGSPFNPAAEPEQQSLSRALLRAMIAAAKADGHIDATEQANIFAAMDRMALERDDKAFVMDELRAPLDVDAVARGARNVEEATEIYAASLLAIDVDNPAERGYLQLLAARLRLDDALVQHLHRTIEEATPAQAGPR